MKNEIAKRIHTILLEKYNVYIENFDQKILLNYEIIHGIDLFFVLYYICEKYQISLNRLTPYDEEVTINGLAEYILKQTATTNQEN